MAVDNEKVLTKIIKVIYKKAEKEHLNNEIVGSFIADIQHIFHKQPDNRDKECYICRRSG